MNFSNRWVQLVAGITGMVAVANFQYSWTLFVLPLQDRHGWQEGDIQYALYFFFIPAQTWLVPVEGYLAERFGPRKLLISGGVLASLGWIINAGASWRFDSWRWPVEIGGSIRHVGQRFLFEDDLTAMLPYTTADLFAFADIPGRDLWWEGLEKMRVSFRVRNVTNALYAQWSDPGYPDQLYLGAPRTFELSASAKW